LAAANAANAASNNIGIIVGAASGGLLFGVLVTAGLAYHTATRPRRIANAPSPTFTSMNIPPPYFHDDEESAAPTMIARPRTFSIPPIANQKIPKFTSPSSRTAFMPTQTQTVVHNPFEAKFHLPPPPPPPPLDD